MNKVDIVKQLSQVLNGFRLHPKLIEDIINLIGGTGQEKQFFNLLVKRLYFLSEYAELAQEHHEEFERLDDTMYSMHIASKAFNIRILYSFIADGTILLHAFYERAGKRQTDYKKSIPIARERLKEEKGENKR